MNNLKEIYDEGLKSGKYANRNFIHVICSETIKKLKENPRFNEVLSKNPDIGEYSLMSAIIEINEELREQFICIIDDWDLIYRCFKEDYELQYKFTELLSGMFKATRAGECFSLAYMTGLLPMKRYNSESLLNNFDEYQMLEPFDYAKHFGFTDDEVKELVKNYNTTLTYEELKEWYGYKLERADICDPYSVLRAITTNKTSCFFNDIKIYEDPFKLINMKDYGLYNDLLRLLDGEKVPFYSFSFQNRITKISSQGDVYCLLVCFGFLGSCDLPKDYMDPKSRIIYTQ